MIVARDKVRAAFQRALQLADAEEWTDAVDEAVLATAQALGLTVEAVMEALEERDEVSAC